MSWDRIPEGRGMRDGDRILSYKDAVKEAIEQAMGYDPSVFVIGLDADDRFGVYGTMLGNPHRDRIIGTPISENAMAGVALGAALSGMRPIHTHMRPDFMILSMDQIINYMAKWRYMTRGKVKVPLVMRAVIGRGWGCAAQHSQSLQGIYSHIPGLTVVMPSTPYDVKGLMLSSIQHDWPVIFLEHRWMYKNTSHVPKEMYTIPLGKGNILRRGKSLTVVATTISAMDTLHACEDNDLDVEIIDPRTIKPLDEELIFESVRKTGRLMIVDYDYPFGGFAAEVSARVAEKCLNHLRAPVQRIAFPEGSAPASGKLEKLYFPSSASIAAQIKEFIGAKATVSI